MDNFLLTYALKMTTRLIISISLPNLDSRRAGRPKFRAVLTISHSLQVWPGSFLLSSFLRITSIWGKSNIVFFLKSKNVFIWLYIHFLCTSEKFPPPFFFLQYNNGSFQECIVSRKEKSQNIYKTQTYCTSYMNNIISVRKTDQRFLKYTMILNIPPDVSQIFMAFHNMKVSNLI